MEEELEKYQKALGLLYDALSLYADPDFYFAIMILADRPAGGFADDFSEIKESDYDRPMSGKFARETLDKLEKEYGDLIIA